MTSFEWLVRGLDLALEPQTLLWGLVGCLLGTLVGVLPGIGPTSAIAMLLPLTVVLPPGPALVMMAAIYYGAMYGGSTTAIVVNIPGEASSVPTALDGFQLARQGRAGPALGMAALASFVAGTLSLVGLTFFAPALAEVALAFGPPEYFTLTVLAGALVASLSGGHGLKGTAAALLGLLVAMVGLDPVTGAARWTFGWLPLMAGFPFVAVIIGLFAVSEVLLAAEERVTHLYATRLRRLFPTRQDLRAATPAMLRSSAIGFLLGLLPGCSPSVTTFVAYDAERRLSRHPERFGRGAIEGVAAAEAANNATSTGGFVPLFSLGLPSGPVPAVLLGGLMMYGLDPGPGLFQEHPDLVWTIIASMYVGNVILLVLNLPLIGLWVRVARIPFALLGPAILVLSALGAYSLRYSLFDVGVAMVFGLVGYGLRKLDFPIAPLVLANVLEPMLEESFRQSLTMAGGSAAIFVTRPLAATFLVLAAAVLALGILRRPGAPAGRAAEAGQQAAAG
ncbi:tripartite tricarboxylate transporter permease [Thermaerobacter sp. PB12/4term]|uniref:tripartite tricarboxylate transporter permease n=1 Tax=Thermaerobacter sp. PB12/4term TaxID=2293838 RepID=UPI000E3285A9|nr:tripartite tricarboxylate transporter permease [Thermaerobacter sp. PB12/4term]QIA26769.1 tripartite tricarboxylate transporter permease [Thermaerobacter sp. PB12/4term]